MSKYNPCPDQAGARISWSGHLVIVVLESVVVVSFCNAPYIRSRSTSDEVPDHKNDVQYFIVFKKRWVNARVACAVGGER